MFHLVNDLFLELIALCNPISSHTLSFWTNIISFKICSFVSEDNISGPVAEKLLLCTLLTF